jgi:hypothetical protein
MSGRSLIEQSGLSPKDLAVIGGIAAVIWLIYQKGLSGAAGAAGKALVDVAGGAVTGVVTGVSEQIGLPTPTQTTTDPAVARWIIDDPRGGYRQASMWASAVALAEAWAMPAGSGIPPPPGSAIAQRFPPYIENGATGGW